MQALLAGDFHRYFRDAALGDGSCVFVHVPKTAGTSLRQELAAFLQPDVNIAVDYADTSRSFGVRMDEAVEAFLARTAAQPVRFASGHILGRHVQRIRARLPGTRFVTFLRDPVQRVVSDYRHQRSARHANHAEFIARVPSLDAYVELAAEQEKMATHLVAPEVLRRRDPAACVADMLATYAFIGVQELYGPCFRTLTTLLGRPARPRLRENVNEADGVARELTPALAERIRDVNPIDVALYEAVFPRWQRLRDALAEHLE